MADISEAELQEQKDAIQLFNDANNGKVNIHDLRKLLRSFGEKKIDTSENILLILIMSERLNLYVQ